MTPFRLAHAAVFLAGLAVWTWSLLTPDPFPTVQRELTIDRKFIVAKSLHFGTYAALTVVGWFLPPPGRWRWAVVAFLMLHGVGTEIGQWYVPHRTGTVRDMLIDWAGVVTGLLALQFVRRWKR